jgi:hypothetical protein
MFTSCILCWFGSLKHKCLLIDRKCYLLCWFGLVAWNINVYWLTENVYLLCWFGSLKHKCLLSDRKFYLLCWFDLVAWNINVHWLTENVYFLCWFGSLKHKCVYWLTESFTSCVALVALNIIFLCNSFMWSIGPPPIGGLLLVFEPTLPTSPSVYL